MAPRHVLFLVLLVSCVHDGTAKLQLLEKIYCAIFGKFDPSCRYVSTTPLASTSTSTITTSTSGTTTSTSTSAITTSTSEITASTDDITSTPPTTINRR